MHLHQPRLARGTGDGECRPKAALPLALLWRSEDEPVLVARRVLGGSAQRALGTFVSAAHFLDSINSDTVSYAAPLPLRLSSGSAGVPEPGGETKAILASPPIRDHSARSALVPRL